MPPLFFPSLRRERERDREREGRKGTEGGSRYENADASAPHAVRVPLEC